MGMLQDWSGFAIHTYSYQNVQKDDALLGKESTATGLGGVPYREGIFSSWNDPAIYGLFYHAALILRRAGVQHIEISEECTVCQSHRFWSHRVTGGVRGAQGAIILCKEASQ